MAIFNVAFLNPKLRRGKSGGVKSGLLLDEIQLLENELMGDSDLSLFDYDRLINKTMETTAITVDIDKLIPTLLRQKSVNE